MFRFEHGYFSDVFLYSLYSFSDRFIGVFFFFAHTHLMNRDFVDKTCLALKMFWFWMPCLNIFLYYLLFFYMKKVLPLSRWKKEKPVESDCFSDEEVSEYEKVLIPKKQQPAKRKRGVNKAADFKRPKTKNAHPKKATPRTNNQVPKKRPRASMDVLGPSPGPPLKRFKSN